ncbi:SHOCT domain-containing protein [Aquibacillus albus]|uniref:Membrane protein n=1 Tax=Aquibacillus albus TaxID=1168171 RepID=A0ABS2MXE6_9BACI|nr:SHOCT domain-containing protein [Aquibacillus albus]MBM7570562.1 putative membrane protein [Aquibacillus albus]
MMNGFNCDGMGLSMMFGGGIFMLLFWGLIIALVVYLVRNSSRKNSSNNTDKAVDLLRQRYAQGEISSEEYSERLNRLMDQ